MKRRAFSLVEILIAMVILSVAMFALLVMNSSSNKGSMDAYYDLQAVQLAKEPLEILSAFGYRWLADPANELPGYPLNRWTTASGTSRYPMDANQFERIIERDTVTDGSAKAIRIKVTVRARESENMKKVFLRNQMVLQALIPESSK